jgi:tetratricopeptide (TPR) repeat protein
MALAAGALLLAACSGTATSAGPTPAPSAAAPSAAPVVTSTPSTLTSPAPAASQLPLPGADARVLIDQATAAVRSDPNDSQSLLTLGLAWYQHARETADPSDYGRADEAFDRLLALKPSDTDAIVGKATIALARHQFADALRLGQTAQTQSPHLARVWGVIGDALVELGRYDESADAVQTMVDLRPDLSSYSRVSYQRELRGHLDSAITAMEDAVLAGGPNTENTEYVRVLLGNLWFLSGDLDKAEASYSASLAHSPGYVYALAGLARVAAARGDVAGAIDLYQQATDRVPFPDLLIALGETQEAAGRTTDSAATYQFVRDIEALFTANGVNTDLDIALFEADHGDVALALTRAQEAFTEAPTVRAADALGWALYRNGRFDDARPYAEQALRLGSVEPAYLFHAGMIAAAQGDVPAARQWLTASLARNPGWSPLRAPIAQQALGSLPATSPDVSR